MACCHYRHRRHRQGVAIEVEAAAEARGGANRTVLALVLNRCGGLAKDRKPKREKREKKEEVKAHKKLRMTSRLKNPATLLAEPAPM